MGRQELWSLMENKRISCGLTFKGVEECGDGPIHTTDAICKTDS